MRSKQTEICTSSPLRLLPRVDRVLSLAATVNGEMTTPTAHTTRERRRFFDFQCAKIMNSSRNEIATGTSKRKSLLFNSKVFMQKRNAD